ncbi:glycoside hydrolase family 128 protein [Cucurbitaria berberidis CBS 394.84]|uniref:Glycoside hydrolase family 128 protein n=1 Tax=Cucurbitaria berberidis CBS 394.84 TaxID=1168544 RepID=A0A9P4GNJ6_9PLEO|nr:glycoside hydrolase family 128 protein [Cucurbitaria berberidis CBS 394.84]KAF1848442.1 glycoside hydrolase family 128 protein [Cucurbitaria berberidis CBS 394.84]
MSSSTSTMKLSLLALVSVAAAVPHYGAHSKFHSLKASSQGKPYPSGGWSGNYNSTAVPYPTGAGDDKTTTIHKTSTSTHTIVSTIRVKPSASATIGVSAADAPTGQCGATVTVTASEKVTITVTPSGGYDAPSSTPAVEKPTTTPATEYSAATPKGKQPATTPAAEYPAETPKAEQTTSSKVEKPVVPTPFVAPSLAQKEPVAYSSAVPSAVSSAASSAAPSATPSSGGGSYTGVKRGLAYNDAGLCKTFGSNYGFGYNWGQVENNDIGTKFIPTMHGPSKSTAEEWLANVDKAVKKGSNAVMGFNECDHAEQCNLSPEAACSAWKQYMNPVKSKYPEVTVIGPSVTNGAAPMGLDWLDRFHTACSDAVVDATNIHFYDIYETATIDRFKAQVEKAAKIYGKKVWITEFGLNPGSATPEQAASFLKDAMTYLDNSDKVQGYSWFMVGSGENQLNSGSGLSALGKLYAGSY